MSDSLEKAARELAAAHHAHKAHVAALASFCAACNIGDWPAAELARLGILATLEAYLDALMAANRGIRQAMPALNNAPAGCGPSANP